MFTLVHGRIISRVPIDQINTLIDAHISYHRRNGLNIPVFLSHVDASSFFNG